MPESSTVLTGNLGPKVAAFTIRIDGRPVAVINSEASTNPELRTQAAFALIGAGLDAGLVLGAIHGVRS
ncbi:hypothetical protein [Streptomyces sp. NPDC058664]|uniref:hypothetical protein n=1 Tax=unclassified Streptomyces TaxID=2593676 RepID=UPI0036641605